MKNWIKTRGLVDWSQPTLTLQQKKGQNAIVFNILYDIIPNAWQSPVFQSKLKTKQKERLREVHLRRIIILINYNICKDSNEPIITRNKYKWPAQRAGKREREILNLFSLHLITDSVVWDFSAYQHSSCTSIRDRADVHASNDSCDFVNNSYDYRPNWTSLSRITITNTIPDW